jgi:hypothetical protein
MRASGESAPDFTGQAAFEAYWKPLLLPEMTAVKERPLGYILRDAEFTVAEGVKWNSTYSAALFTGDSPEHEELRKLRNAGALLRDWEEAVSWIWLEYRWDTLFDPLAHGENLLIWR